mmetsp:Transcript_45758/g.133229  ORF Transcript_45758/g.133229 Transcript_45758/m.133229 type:complete len:347 (+) Transcript_45758:10-1050(+)
MTPPLVINHPPMQFAMDSAPTSMTGGAGKRRKGKSEAAGLHEFDRPSQTGKGRVVDGAGAIVGRTLSKACPEWMHAPIVSNREFLECSGLVHPEQPTSEPRSPGRNPQPMSCDNPQWMVAHYDRIHDFMQSAGMPKYHMPARGSAAGCYMKAPSLCGESPGSARAVKVPRAKAISPEMPEWLALTAGWPHNSPSEVSTAATTKTAGRTRTGPRMAKRAEAAAAQRLMNVSAASPPWMKSPVFSNSAHFSDMAEYLSKEVLEQPKGRKPVKYSASGVYVNSTAVSTQSPEWMVQQAKGNAVELKGRGHPEPSGKPRRPPEALSFKPPSRGPGSKPTPAASTVSARSR